MKSILICLLFLNYTTIAFAGDDASGPIKYSTDLSVEFTEYSLVEKDLAWSRSLVKNHRYKGKVIHFVKTSIPLNIDGKLIHGNIYKALEIEGVFYVINGDSILEVGTRWPYSPGVGGFSMHYPKSKNFIVCLNFRRMGVPHLSGTEVKKGKISWKGHEWKRIK